MQFAILVTLGIVAQTMQFRNEMEGELISIRIYCETHKDWANDQKPLQLRTGTTASIDLHPGYFTVIARNSKGQRDQNRRVLKEGEVDRMVIAPLASGGPRQVRKRPTFKIIDDYPLDDFD